MASERALALSEIDPARVPYFSLILVHRRGLAWGPESLHQERAR